MELKKIIIHDLKKKSGGNATLKLAARELAIKPVHISFIKDLALIYYRKSNPIYGSFNKAKDEYPFQTYLKEYLAGNTSFLQFTAEASEHFKKIINGVSQATGGYVLFCHFGDGDDFVAAIMLNDRSSYMIEELDVKENFQLDIEKLDVANFINCTKWEHSDNVYLSFTKGKKEVSQYFQAFIGCTDSRSARDASESFKTSLIDYLGQAPYTAVQKEEIREAVFAHCRDQKRRNQEIKLDVVSGLVNSAHPEEFQEFASAEKYQVSASFKPYMQELRSLQFYTYESADLKIAFNSKLLRTMINYDEALNVLTINKVPERLRLQLTGKTSEESDE